MKYLKLYEQFRMMESSNWSDEDILEVEGKDYNIKWGRPKLELAEIIQTLNHHKSSLPKKWIDSFGVILNGITPKDFNHQTDPSPDYINKPLDPSMKGQATPTNPEIKYSCYELLQLKQLTIDDDTKVEGEDLIPYHNFINEIHEAFWSGKPTKISESDLEILAKNKASEQGESEDGFQKIIENEKHIDNLKIYYDVYIKTQNNPNGILDSELLGEAGCVPKIKEALPNMKEPINPEHKQLWEKYRVSDEELAKNPDAYQEFASEIYNMALRYDGYFGKSFEYFKEALVKGKEVPLSAALKIGNELYLTGGNRRMTFWCSKKILPTIWVWM